MELFSLLDVVQNDVLGNISHFRTQYANVIQAGLKKNAGLQLALLARQRIKELKTLYQPHFKRRLKKEMFTILSSELNVLSLQER